MIPHGAQRIIDARNKGMKPAELVLVSLIGRLNEANPCVYADPRREYEWFWTRGLQLCIFASAEVNWRPVALSIKRQSPSSLYLWDADRREGAEVFLIPNMADLDKPRSEWRLALNFLPWLPSQNEEFAWN